MEFVNQYSFTLVAGILIIVFSLFIFRQRIAQREITALIALIIGFLVAYWFFNPGESSTGGGERAQASVGSGIPVLIEFQSPY